MPPDSAGELMTGSRAFGLPFRHHPEPGEHDHTHTDDVDHRGYAAAILDAHDRARTAT
jgi:hypothetical protein